MGQFNCEIRAGSRVNAEGCSCCSKVVSIWMGLGKCGRESSPTPMKDTTTKSDSENPMRQHRAFHLKVAVAK